MPDIVVLPAAREDIIEIYMTTYHGWGEQQAEKYDSGLDAALNSLARNPRKGMAMLIGRIEFRRHLYGTHAIFYQLIEERHVRVIRILHQSMDPYRHLDD